MKEASREPASGEPTIVPGREATVRARYYSLIIVALYFALQMAGLKSAPLTDDDDFYIPAGISYASWLGRVVDGPPGAFERSVMDAAFTPNNEHPPLAKYVFGICHFAFSKWLGPADATRVGTVLFSTLTAFLLLSLAIGHLGGTRGLRVGGLAVLALLTLPRFYFHSHAATLDVPIAAVYLWAAYVTLRAERSTTAALLAGIPFGLAAATKLNGPFLVLAYILFVLLTRGLWRKPKIPDLRQPGFVIPPIPVALLSMMVVGPLVFLAVWPWMWNDTVARIQGYVAFHLNHYPIFFLYLGQVYAAKPFAPWHAPFVTTLLTVPLATLALAAGGFLAAWPAIRLRLRFLSGPDDDFRKEGDLWLFAVINAALTIGVVAFAGTPIYGGEKLFMPFFPFLCLFAGGGANMLWERLEAGMASPFLRKIVPASLMIVASMSGVALGWKFWGYPLSQWNGLADGARGAAALGMERQYYDLAFRDLVTWLSKEGPPNLRVHFLPNNWEYVRTFGWYAKGGDVRKDIQVVQSEAQADWVIVTHERRFARYGDDLQRYRGRPIIREQTVDGVPIWSVIDARKK